MAGKGVFAAAAIPAGTVLGAYPGRPRGPAQMASKCEAAPAARDYCFRWVAGWLAGWMGGWAAGSTCEAGPGVQLCRCADATCSVACPACCTARHCTARQCAGSLHALHAAPRRTRTGALLDPTDAAGALSQSPAPGLPWLPVDVTLAYVNEPPLGAGGCSVSVEDDPSDACGLLCVAVRDIAAGEEIYMDYGTSYDRSRYGQQAAGGGARRGGARRGDER